MMDTVLNLMFRCSHRHLTRPVTPVRKQGEPQGGTYVVCLDCGKQFAYDLDRMRVGRQISKSAAEGVLAPGTPQKVPRKVKWAVAASALPLAWIIGAGFLNSKKRKAGPEPAPPGKPKPGPST
jgi:hypothetical protein